MMRRWTFAQRVGAGLSACLLAGLLLLGTLLSAVYGPPLTGDTGHGALPQALLAGLLGLAGVGTLGFVLHRTLAPLHARHEHSEQRLQLLMDGVTDYALCFLDRHGRVTAWSAGAARLSGWAEAEVLGRDADRLYPEDEVAAGVPRAHRERAAREGRLLSEGWRRRRDGSRFWAETLLTALHDGRGRLRGFAEVTRDITERRRIERAQALFAEAGRVLQPLSGAREVGEALTRLCVPEVADACILFMPSEDGTVRPQAVACAQPEAACRLWEPLLRCPEDGEEGPSRVVRTGRSELLPELDVERTPRALDGTAHGELLRALGVTSALTVPLAVGNRVLGALCLLSTGPHRRFGEVDRAFMEELAARAALALDNARLLTQAQDALELIGVAAHDLGNPLSSLQLRLWRLRSLACAGEPRMRDGLAGAEAETRRLGRLVHNLLDLSRLSAGRMVLDTEEVDLAALAREVMDRHCEQAAASGCAVTLRMEDGATGQWDRQRLDRVVTNLVSNALKFGRGRPVEVRVHADAHHARLTVKDAGAGIAPEAQQRLFRRFQRVHSGAQVPGTGLGLYIVRQLVEAHGGSIHVQSRAGEGAEFTVELPRIPRVTSCLPAEARA
ncbi:PAS domain-containing sensor histidine kinase [Myxococcus sp. RHSTA-1-4]|uniref:PAS domain-containing sensor histidine kinase n=1 Tax=Myxococcus sp. RHSTA-1-4 TaxID=2874601 RepID=UPI001CC08B95|nr:ATP-binding protein [Myxococcus sp. RHSTA-1-4]MBZ4418694.1 PAS domain S-box protein [Myxococcus sp. RHSTA-1-4]